MARVARLGAGAGTSWCARRPWVSRPRADGKSTGVTVAAVGGRWRVSVCRVRRPGTCRIDLQHRRAGREPLRLGRIARTGHVGHRGRETAHELHEGHDGDRGCVRGNAHDEERYAHAERGHAQAGHGHGYGHVQASRPMGSPQLAEALAPADAGDEAAVARMRPSPHVLRVVPGAPRSLLEHLGTPCVSRFAGPRRLLMRLPWQTRSALIRVVRQYPSLALD